MQLSIPTGTKSFFAWRESCADCGVILNIGMNCVDCAEYVGYNAMETGDLHSTTLILRRSCVQLAPSLPMSIYTNIYAFQGGFAITFGRCRIAYD